MSTNPSDHIIPDKRLAAVCGLFCPACRVFIESTEDSVRLQIIAKLTKRSVEEIECHGCRSEKRGIFCNKYCKMTQCASQKGIDFCGECVEYPCSELKAFQARVPDRIELWESHQRIKDVGYETWYEEMMEHYSCPKCRAINSAYDLACRKCGASPSCCFVKEHWDVVSKLIGKAGP